MTSLTTHVKRFVGPIIANRWTGIVAARVLGNRIPHRGLTIDTSSPVVDPETKAALLVNGYESAEYRFVQRYLPTDCDVIELGGSLGVISCTIRRRIAADRRQFVIEADPRLADVLRRNLAINDCTRGVEIIEAAISYGVGDTVRFALGERSDSGRIAADADGLPTIEVPAVTLAQLIERHGLSDFALVCDIEGVEWRIVEHDLDALAKARIIVMETHGTPDRGSHDDLIAAILATSRFTLLDGYGPVVVLEPEVDVKTRLAIVVTHPIQHFVPFYRAIAADPEIELHVLFGAPIGVQSYYDAEMQSQISWNMDMLGGYSHEFLGAVPEGGQSGVRQPNTPVIAERLAAFAPDVVLVYGHMQANVFRAIWWCRRHKVPLMTIGDSELLRNRTSVTKALKEVVVRAIFRRYSALLSVGDRNAEFYRYYGAPADRIFRSPFTIDEATYRAAKANRAALRTETRAKYDIADDAIVALFVGKLSPRKRPGDLIDALAQTTGRKIIALFAGNGELMGELRAKAAAQGVEARFAGFVNVDKLPGLYAAADMLVHPSQHDPHPLICSEGSCIGLPLILSDRIGAVGPTDIAREGENTIVFPCTDIPALATAIDALAGDDTRRAAMSERSLAIFDQCDVKASVAGLKQGIATARARPR